MGESADYNDALRHQAIDEMQETLDYLEELKDIYKINDQDFSRIEEMIIETGLEIVKINSHKDSTESLLEDTGSELQELRKVLEVLMRVINNPELKKLISLCEGIKNYKRNPEF